LSEKSAESAFLTLFGYKVFTDVSALPNRLIAVRKKHEKNIAQSY